MTATGIVLLVIGGLFFAISFFLPDGKKKEEEKITEERIRELIDKEMADAKTRIDDMVEETVTYSVEKTERALEKLSNEKIMAVDEYSETVLKKINDNHNEAVFLYDMLNDKDEKLKNVGEELQISKSEIENERKELEEKKKAEEIRKQEEKRIREEAEAKKAETELLPEKSGDNDFKPMDLEHYEVQDGVAVKVKSSSKASSEKKSEKHKNPNREAVSVSFETGKETHTNSNEMIRRLHEEGKTNMQIAKELGLGVGEVKLVIDLFSSKKN